MFGNKKKIDSKIRFQNSRFKSRLRQAREYKRPARIMPRTSTEVFLSKIGLGSWPSRFITILVFLLLVYLIFIPNFIFVRHISINGVGASDSAGVESLTNSFLSQSLPWPQKNLVLLSKNKLKDYLLKNDQRVFTVNSINKKLPSTLVINITPRVDQFLISTASSTYFTVSNDGLITSELFLGASGTLPSNLPSIKLNDGGGLVLRHQALSPGQINIINQLSGQLPEIAKFGVSYFQMPNLESPDLAVYTKGGSKFMFSLSPDITQTLNRLKLMLSQISGPYLQKIYYVDMRFGSNGYICYKGTPCAQNTNLQDAAGTP